MYNFQESLAKGEQGEKIIDEILRLEGYRHLQPVSMDMQRCGIDRTASFNNCALTLEYKTDFKAHKTEQFFIETSVIDSANKGKHGWARYSLAQKLIYFVPGAELLFIMEMTYIKQMLNNWIGQYRYFEGVENEGGYYGNGILVPFNAVAGVATKIKLTSSVSNDIEW